MATRTLMPSTLPSALATGHNPFLLLHYNINNYYVGASSHDFSNHRSHRYVYNFHEIRRANSADCHRSYHTCITHNPSSACLLHLSSSSSRRRPHLKFGSAPLHPTPTHHFGADNDDHASAAAGSNYSLPSSSQDPIISKKDDTGDMRSKVAKLGLSAILAYGFFDGVTYTIFFVLAFLGFERSTGKNPAANLQALLGIVVLMWTGNNFTRPFRLAGAAALAPFVDKVLEKIQRTLNLPNVLVAFVLVVASFASLCFSIVGLLILSRWGKS